jgi:hypothetical protein
MFLGGWVGGWVGGWMDGSKSGFKDCLEQSKILSPNCGWKIANFKTVLLRINPAKWLSTIASNLVIFCVCAGVLRSGHGH